MMIGSLKRADHRGLHLIHIVGHLADDIPLTLLGIVAHGKRENLREQLITQVAHHPMAYGGKVPEREVGEEIL